MARKYKTEKSTGKSILLVDDNLEYLDSTRLVLEHEGHQVFTASSGREALSILHKASIDLVLLDYFMPEMTGEETVIEIRKFNKDIQIILQTGYSSENPPRDILHRLNIQGYHDKSEGTDKLLLWVDVGLKSSGSISYLTKSKQGLTYILDITPEMHKIQPLEDLHQGILWQMCGLLGFGNSFSAVSANQKTALSTTSTHEAFLAILKDDMVLRIHAGIGRFSGKILLEDALENEEITLVKDSVHSESIQYYERCTIIPLHAGQTDIGLIYIDKNIHDETDTELLQLFANQAAAAIQNSQLYEMATRDQLSGSHVGRYALQLFIKELKTAFHTKSPISLILLCLDNLKSINEGAGHSAADRAISILGKVLKKATRSNDLAGRHGGDEFTVVLPQTDSIGARNVADRIRELLSGEKIYDSGHVYPLQSSLGIVTIDPLFNASEEFPNQIPHIYFQAMEQHAMSEANKLMHESKRNSLRIPVNEKQISWVSYNDAVKTCQSTGVGGFTEKLLNG